MNTNQIINEYSLVPYMSKYKSYFISLELLDHIQIINTFIIFNIRLSIVKTMFWLCIFQTTTNIKFFDPLGLPYAFYTARLKTFLNKVVNLLVKMGSEYRIYQPKTLDFMHGYILFFEVVDVLTLNSS